MKSKLRLAVVRPEARERIARAYERTYCKKSGMRAAELIMRLAINEEGVVPQLLSNQLRRRKLKGIETGDFLEWLSTESLLDKAEIGIAGSEEREGNIKWVGEGGDNAHIHHVRRGAVAREGRMATLRERERGYAAEEREERWGRNGAEEVMP